MVRTLATDRRQLQLVIAPASAGKTTALRVLAYTWTGGAGHTSASPPPPPPRHSSPKRPASPRTPCTTVDTAVVGDVQFIGVVLLGRDHAGG